MIVDKNEGIWVHNFNSHKLMKFDSLLKLEKEWEANEIELANGSSTLTQNQDRTLIYWYKGGNEGVVISADTKEIVDSFDYMTDLCPVMKGMVPLKDQPLLLVVTNNHAFDEPRFHYFDTKRNKILNKYSYSDITGGSLDV